MPSSLAQVGFDCSVAVSGVTLDIRVILTNRGAVQVGVFNRISKDRPDGTLAFLAETAFVELEGDELLVRKMALPVPAGLTMAVYVPPRASCLLPGKSLAETIRLGLPAKVMQPYRRAMLRGGQMIADRPASATVVTVAYGFFLVEEPVRLLARNPAHPDALTAYPPDLAVRGQQVLSRSIRLVEPIQVLDYRAVPWP